MRTVGIYIALGVLGFCGNAGAVSDECRLILGNALSSDKEVSLVLPGHTSSNREISKNLENPFVGMDQLPPDSQAFRVLMNDILSRRKIADLPMVFFSDLKSLERIDVGGIANKGMFRGTYNGKSVAVKVYDLKKRSSDTVLREARWLMALNKMGVGAECFGVTRTTEGDLALVSEYVAGAPFSYNSNSESVLKLPQQPYSAWAAHIRELGQKLNAAGVGYVKDLQVMLTKEGRVVLIDPEFFEMRTPVGAVEESPLAATERLVDRLRQMSHKP